MAEKADDLYLPNAVLLRIIRDSLPERTIVSREARSAISKSASSFILYVTSLASAYCESSKRKTLTATDILNALKEMQFDHYLPVLNTFLEKYRQDVFIKKSIRADGLKSHDRADGLQSNVDSALKGEDVPDSGEVNVDPNMPDYLNDEDDYQDVDDADVEEDDNGTPVETFDDDGLDVQ